MRLQILRKDEDPNNPLYASSDCQELLKIYADYYPANGFEVPWVAYFIIENNVVVGTCSFIGPPSDNQVELAYWTFADNEGRGIASFACEALIRIARETDPSIRITAKSAPEENASTHILKKHGFIRNGIVQDDGIGDAWYWELS